MIEFIEIHSKIQTGPSRWEIKYQTSEGYLLLNHFGDDAPDKVIQAKCVSFIGHLNELKRIEEEYVPTAVDIFRKEVETITEEQAIAIKEVLEAQKNPVVVEKTEKELLLEKLAEYSAEELQKIIDEKGGK